ncbi:DUF3302 domain-containing protein [Bremerella sp. T1]|uniref:DUF3302 domain-containing protein n=1 Tax=Bremerella sp. TYQ1 TaxID=3119568 RepID=UPI001CCBA400|nr:DUF3302 domain-containing protein [Bremerella volcania]UBM38340.1 DUF3302 domain-containing protein [Bremerella volcania]
MDFATYFAWFVIAVLFFVIVAAIVALGSLPGNIAKQRNHPHATAINAASWIGLALGGITWPLAFIWAFIPFGASPGSAESDVERLREQVAQLQAELATVKKSAN